MALIGWNREQIRRWREVDQTVGPPRENAGPFGDAPVGRNHQIVHLTSLVKSGNYYPGKVVAWNYDATATGGWVTLVDEVWLFVSAEGSPKVRFPYQAIQFGYHTDGKALFLAFSEFLLIYAEIDERAYRGGKWVYKFTPQICTADGEHEDTSSLLNYTSSVGGWIDSETTTEAVSGTTSQVETLTPYHVTGGTWTITIDGVTTADLAWNASAGTVQSAIESILGSGSVTVAFPDPEWTITFTDTDEHTVSVDSTTLTPLPVYEAYEIQNDKVTIDASYPVRVMIWPGYQQPATVSLTQTEYAGAGVQAFPTGYFPTGYFPTGYWPTGGNDTWELWFGNMIDGTFTLRFNGENLTFDHDTTAAAIELAMSEVSTVTVTGLGTEDDPWEIVSAVSGCTLTADFDALIGNRQWRFREMGRRTPLPMRRLAGLDLDDIPILTDDVDPSYFLIEGSDGGLYRLPVGEC